MRFQHRSNRFMAIIFVFSLILLIPETATTSSVLEYNLQELTTKSSDIVTGRVTKQYVLPSENGKIFYTYSEIEVEESLKGGGTKLVVQQVGGTVGEIRQVAHGIVLLRENEETLLFLQDSAERSSRNITGVSQGYFRIATDAKTGERIAQPVQSSDLEILRRQANGRLKASSDSRLEPMALSELKSKIRAIRDR